MRTILCTGDREWRDTSCVAWALSELRPGDRVIVGDARGLDAIVYRVARTWMVGLKLDPPYIADWRRYGRAAGPLRNRTMLAQQPDEVWAFHDDLSHSKGTRDCVSEAIRLGIPVRYFHSGDDHARRQPQPHPDSHAS